MHILQKHTKTRFVFNIITTQTYTTSSYFVTERQLMTWRASPCLRCKVRTLDQFPAAQSTEAPL